MFEDILIQNNFAWSFNYVTYVFVDFVIPGIIIIDGYRSLLIVLVVTVLWVWKNKLLKLQTLFTLHFKDTGLKIHNIAIFVIVNL